MMMKVLKDLNNTSLIHLRFSCNIWFNFLFVLCKSTAIVTAFNSTNVASEVHSCLEHLGLGHVRSDI